MPATVGFFKPWIFAMWRRRLGVGLAFGALLVPIPSASRADEARQSDRAHSGTSMPSAPGDEHWWDGIGDYSLRGLPGRTYALALYGGDLCAGGDFYDNSRDLRSIARWDGSRWQPLEEGLLWGWPPPCPGGTCATWCSALAVYNGSLVAGGRFNFAGLYDDFRRASNIARWDGVRWYSLGTGCNDRVTSLAVYRGELIASGYFTEAGGQPVNHIARWDGSRWQPLGGGLNARALDMVEYRGDLIAVGGFDQADDLPAKHIARWDGASWHAFDNEDVEYGAAGVFRDTLYANVFQLVEGYSRPIISRWSGGSWEPTPGGELGYFLLDYTVYNDRLVATGDFYVGRPDQPRNIARWDGARWEAMGSGLGVDLEGAGYSLLVVGQSLYVAGDFLQAGGKTSWYLARWDDDPTPVAVEALEARWEVTGVRLSWRLAPAILPSIEELHVERAPETAGPYVDLTPEPLAPLERMSFLDPHADPEGGSWYRLRLVANDRTVSFAGPVEVAPLERDLDFALAPPVVPSKGAVVIRYSLGTPSESIDLTIYDVRGRVVRCLESGPASSGNHVRFWDRRSALGVEVPRGIYVVRLGVEGTVASRKLPLWNRE